MIDFYGETANYIHLKFGDARKMYNFTEEFKKEHPNFCTEYVKYFSGKESKFEDPLQLVNYVEHYNIPVHFYFNYTDTPAKGFRDVKNYLGNERMPSNYGNYTDGKMLGWDGEVEIEDKAVGMDVKCETASEVTEYIVDKFTHYTLNNPESEETYSNEVQPIFNAVLDIVDRNLR